jgi:hypothetical protein
MPFNDRPRIAITGILSRRRAEISQLILQNGGFFDTAVTNGTNWVVVGRSPGGTKLRAAERYNVPQITENQFMEYCRTGVRPVPNPRTSVYPAAAATTSTLPTTSTSTPHPIVDRYGNPINGAAPTPRSGPKPAPTPDYERFSIADFFFVDDVNASDSE